MPGRFEADICALIRAAERWRGFKVSEFEQRQLKAIRDEIDKDFTARNAQQRALRSTQPHPISPAMIGLDRIS